MSTRPSEIFANAYQHRKQILLLCLLTLSLIFTSSLAHAQETSQADKQHVLILNSYHQGLSWTDGIMQGIQSTFADAGENVELHVEYMDTKRLYNEEYLADLYTLFQNKYTAIPIDVIIVSDNNAFEFMRQFQPELFPNTPVVFSGVNNFSDDMLTGLDNFTGIVEATDIKSTLGVMLAQNPDANQVVIINDQTPTGQAMMGELTAAMSQFEDQVDFVIKDDFELGALQNEVSNLPADTLILMLVANRDNTGQFFTYEESLQAITDVSPVPVYSVWDFYLGYGIVGGMLTSSVDQGRLAANMALDLLAGEDIANLPIVRESPNRYMFDFQQLEKFNIPVDNLPANSLLVNEPTSFYDQYKYIMWGIGVVLLALTIIVLILLITNSQRKQAQQALQASVERRGRQVALSTQVAQAISQATDFEDLYQRIVTEIKERFGYYHTQLLRFDARENAVHLIAGYGETGAEMVAQGHTMPSGIGLIGTAAATGETILRTDLSNDPDWQPNPLLPDTKGEIAVPIKLGDEVLGVLDVQSNKANALSTDDQLLLEGLCGQIAVAIDSTRLTSELQESTTFLNSVIDNIPSMVFVKEAEELRFVRMNKRGQEYFGTSLAEIIGKNDHDFFPEEEADFFIKKDREVLATKKPVDIPEENIESAFGPRILHTTKVPILDAEGNPKYLMGISVDITEQKQTQALLLEEQNRTQAILEAVGIPIVIARVTDGRLIYVNDPLAQLVDVPRDELIGQLTPDFFDNPDDREAYVAALRQEGTVSHYEVLLKRPNGTHFWALLSGQIAQFQGEAVTITSLIDITERHKAIESVQSNEALLRTIINSTPDWIYVKDANHRYRLANRAYADSRQLSPAEIIGKNDLEIGMPEDVVKGDPEKGIRGLWAEDREIMEKGETTIIDEEAIILAGKQVILNTIKVPLRDSEGNVAGIVGFVHDITRQKQTEAMMAKQATELQTVADLSTAVSSSLHSETLLNDIVDRTKERFALYHVHIYLLDETNNTLDLAAGAGEVGKEMVAAGHHIPLDLAHSLVARAARTGKGVIVNDVTADPNFLPNPLLPETKSEMAVPMMVGNKLVGVLDVQADTVDHFTSSDITIQSTLAAQIAVGLENARAYERANEQAAIIESTVSIIATIDMAQTIQYVNKAGLQQLGYASLADVIGKPVDILFPTDGAEERRKPAVKAVQEQGFWRGESMVCTVSGEQIPVDQTITMLRDEEGLPKMLVFNMTDISEQKEAEATQQALTAELEEQLERVNALQRSMTREGWQAFMTASKRPFQGVEFKQGNLHTITAKGENGRSNGSQTSHVIDQTELVNPVKIHGETIGKIGVRNPNGEPLSDEQRELLASLTNQVAEALERARLFEETELSRQEIEEQAAELATVNEISDLVSSQLNLNDLVHTVGARLLDTFSANSVYIALVDENTQTITFPYFVNRTEGDLKVPPRSVEDGGFTGEIYSTRQPLIRNMVNHSTVKSIEADGGRAVGTGRVSDSYIGVPMIVGERVIGVIGLNSYKEIRVYDEDDLPLLTTLGSTIAVAIQNTLQFEETQRRANREALVNEISQKIQNAPTVERALETAVTELGKALNLKRAVVKLNKTDTNGHS